MSSKKRLGRDLISSLPDEILGKILSCLPTKLAATTSVLSKRWRNLLALVDKLDLYDASGDRLGRCRGRGGGSFPEFVEKLLAIVSNVKKFSLYIDFEYEESRVDGWIRTVLLKQTSLKEVYLFTSYFYFIEAEFFTGNTLVDLTVCDQFNLDGRLPPHGRVLFPALKRLTLVGVNFGEFYKRLIYGCPVLEELFLNYRGDRFPWGWTGYVLSDAIKRLTIYHRFPLAYRHLHVRVSFQLPKLVYLDYSDYALKEYSVDLNPLLEEVRLDLRFWERPMIDEDDYSDNNGGEDVVSGDVSNLVIGISHVRTLHLSPDSLEVFHFCCKSMPVFHNLLKLSFESNKERG